MWRGNRKKSLLDFVQLYSELKKITLLELEGSRCSSDPFVLGNALMRFECQLILMFFYFSKFFIVFLYV